MQKLFTVSKVRQHIDRDDVAGRVTKESNLKIFMKGATTCVDPESFQL